MLFANDSGGATASERAGKVLRMREARDRVLGRHLFTPDAWDILLHLRAAGEPRSAQAIRDALGLYDDTVDRWIAVLESEHLAVRLDDGLIDLPPGARERMDTALAAIVP